MDNNQMQNLWNYFLSLEQDLSNTSRYVEPQGQENVYSFEFAKLIILASTEAEATFKALCKVLDGNEYGLIGKYKEIILTNYPQITEAEVFISRLNKAIKPFEEWKNGQLSWWNDYNIVKHSREIHFQKATYNNAVFALAGLYILILYLSKLTQIAIDDSKSEYFSSNYTSVYLTAKSETPLPGFDRDMNTSGITYNGNTTIINCGLAEE